MKTYKLPPGPKGLPYIGNTLDYVRDPLRFTLSVARRYGDVAYYTAGPYKIWLLSHPDHVKDVLVTHSRNFTKGDFTYWLKPMLGEGLLTSEGEFHLRQRRLMQPAFHRQRIASYGEAMIHFGEEMADRWRDGDTVDMSDEMMALTLSVVAKALFNSDVESETREIGEAMDAFMDWWLMRTLPFSNVLQKLPLPVNRRFRQARSRLDATIYRLIRERRATGDQGDLLSMLLLAQDTEGDGGGMTDLQLRDEAMTIFLAGHETTANALTWAWYLLSKHPHVEARLHAELDEVLGGRTPTIEDIPRLTYTDMVFSETLRLFPPAWGVDRKPLTDYEVGGYTLPAGTIVTLSQYVVHHDPRYYPNPFKFDPTRWAPEERAKRPKFAYFPFGAGNRLCIGEQFAWMEGVLLLATLAQKWQMRLAPGHKVGTQPMVTLRPKGGMPMRLVRRNPRSVRTPEAEREVVGVGA